jgi:hypothetical protein
MVTVTVPTVLTMSAFGAIKEPCCWFLMRTDWLPAFGRSITMILPERLYSLCMYKSLEHQLCLVQQQRSYPALVSSSEDRCLPVSIFSFFSYYTFPASLGRSESHTLSSHLICIVEMISKSFIILSILALTSYVNAAPVGPAGQFLFGPRCTRRTLLTFDLGFSLDLRSPVPPIAERAPAPIAVNERRRLRKFLFLSFAVRGRLC